MPVRLILIVLCIPLSLSPPLRFLDTVMKLRDGFAASTPSASVVTETAPSRSAELDIVRCVVVPFCVCVAGELEGGDRV